VDADFGASHSPGMTSVMKFDLFRCKLTMIVTGPTGQMYPGALGVEAG
jgi:hypothetical protein